MYPTSAPSEAPSFGLTEKVGSTSQGEAFSSTRPSARPSTTSARPLCASAVAGTPASAASTRGAARLIVRERSGLLRRGLRLGLRHHVDRERLRVGDRDAVADLQLVQVDVGADLERHRLVRAAQRDVAVRLVDRLDHAADGARANRAAARVAALLPDRD